MLGVSCPRPSYCTCRAQCLACLELVTTLQLNEFRCSFVHGNCSGLSAYVDMSRAIVDEDVGEAYQQALPQFARLAATEPLGAAEMQFLAQTLKHIWGQAQRVAAMTIPDASCQLLV